MKFSSVDQSSIKASTKTTRLGSFDGLRALAAFGVILIHIGILCDYQTTPSVENLQQLFAGVVPFFLVTAFYFAARREMKGDSPWKTFLMARVSRLLVPFLFWGLLYTALRSLLYLKNGQPQELRALFNNPLALFFNGGAVALYFLPLLFVGLCGLRSFAPSLRRISWFGLGFCCLFFLLLQWRIDATENGFDQSGGWAFFNWTTHYSVIIGFPSLSAMPVSRVLLVVLAHLLRCAPLICFALLLARSDFEVRTDSANRQLAFVSGFYVLIFIALSHSALADSTWPLLANLVGMDGLLIALILSEKVPSTPLTTNLGAYTFGIYLVHQVVITLMRIALKNHLPTPFGAPIALFFALAVFSISYFLTALAARGGALARRVFAIEGG